MEFSNTNIIINQTCFMLNVENMRFYHMMNSINEYKKKHIFASKNPNLITKTRNKTQIILIEI